jgi:hypothetical protein
MKVFEFVHFFGDIEAIVMRVMPQCVKRLAEFIFSEDVEGTFSSGICPSLEVVSSKKMKHPLPPPLPVFFTFILSMIPRGYPASIIRKI